MNEPSDKPKRRRFFRFSLRTMLLLMIVGCVVLGWKANKARQQREAVEWVRENGGNGKYGYEFYANGNYVPNAEPPGPAWLRNLIGFDFFTEVNYVFLNNPQVQVSDVTPLAKLTNLKELRLSGTQVSEESILQLQQALPSCIVYSD